MSFHNMYDVQFVTLVIVKIDAKIQRTAGRPLIYP